ncbi:MAG: sigma-54 dependent transcriptional regulator [Alphaproteobacteria bacterium]
MNTNRILLVDDEPAFLRLAGAWLTEQGYEVVLAENAAAARDRFAATRPHLVVLDLVMPPERTPEAGLALIPEFREAPVIVLTAHAEHELALRAVAAGAWDFLAKPVEPELLKFAVSRALAKGALERELAQLKAARDMDDGIVGVSPSMQRLKELIRRIGPADIPVMILGPSGTGKELVAKALHNARARVAGPFVTMHCGAIPAELMESELFGHLKGSFTGAHQDRAGLLAIADGGTLFLDEVGETPPAMQVKLLRFLQEGTYTPVGGREPRTADVRVISATHRDLEGMVAQGEFREDFFYRLKGMMLRTLPLSERREDIAPLAVRCLGEAGALQFSSDALAWLASQEWPGNARELKAVVTCAAALAGSTESGVIAPDDLVFARYGDAVKPEQASAAGNLTEAVAGLERRMITAALAAESGNRSAAARRLGVSRVGLLKMMARLGLR